MDALLEHYADDRKTTLNRMRAGRKREADAFKILIACLLSLRARDENTEKVSKALFAVADTPEKILSLPLSRLEKLIFSSGHFRKKARVLQEVSREVLERFGGEVPSTREELLSIRGVGPKTANIVLAFAFGKDVIPVDVHCHRVPNRLGWVKTEKPEQTEKALEEVLPRKYWREFNGIIVKFGKEICQPVSPWCSKCPVLGDCERVGILRSR